MFAAETIGGVPGAIATFIPLRVVRLVTGLRVEGDQEGQGLDTALHGESVT